MPAKRRTSKRAAKKAAAPTQSFPLEEGQYVSTPAVSRSSVSRGPVVQQIRNALGVSAGTTFDVDARDALLAFQKDRGLPVTGVVTAEDWNLLFEAPEPSDEPQAHESGDTPQGAAASE